MKQRVDLRIAGGMVVTNDGEGRILNPGDVYVGGAAIVAVGGAADRLDTRYEAASTMDAAGMLALPGLVNAHYHSSDTLLRGLIPGMPLEVWSAYTDAGRLDRDPREVYVSAQLGAIEALATGTTAILDHLRLSPSLSEEGLSASVQAHLDAGIRVAVAPVVSDLPLVETIPVEVGTLPADLRAFVAAARPQAIEEQLRVCGAFFDRWAGRHPRVLTLMGPSAPQRCSDRLLETCAAMAARFGLGLHMHALESRAQRTICQRRFGGRTARHLGALGVLGPRTSLVHAVWTSDDDLEAIADAGATIVHCPTANLRLGSGIARVPEMLQRGIRVALGTDGVACNDSLNLFAVMKTAGLVHSLGSVDHTVWPSPHALLRMATTDAAAVLGCQDHLGALVPGRQADIVLIGLDQPALAPMHDPVGQVVFATEGARVDTVLVGGEVVLRGGRSTRVDEAALYAEARALAAGVVRRNQPAYHRADVLAPHLAAMVRAVAGAAIEA